MKHTCTAWVRLYMYLSLNTALRCHSRWTITGIDRSPTHRRLMRSVRLLMPPSLLLLLLKSTASCTRRHDVTCWRAQRGRGSQQQLMPPPRWRARRERCGADTRRWGWNWGEGKTGHAGHFHSPRRHLCPVAGLMAITCTRRRGRFRWCKARSSALHRDRDWHAETGRARERSGCCQCDRRLRTYSEGLGRASRGIELRDRSCVRSRRCRTLFNWGRDLSRMNRSFVVASHRSLTSRVQVLSLDVITVSAPSVVSF